MAHFIRATAEDLPHPTDSTRTLWDATRDDGTLYGPGGNVTINEEVLAIHEMQYGKADNVGVTPLGSGSDYTVFLQRNGVRLLLHDILSHTHIVLQIPSGNGGFGSTLHDPVYHYHSVFDSERWQELYADPGFSRHVSVFVMFEHGISLLISYRSLLLNTWDCKPCAWLARLFSHSMQRITHMN